MTQPPDPDDWFAEPIPAPPTRSTQARTRENLRADPAEADDGDIVVGGRSVTVGQLIAAAVILVLLIVAGLAAAGVFSSGKHNVDGLTTTGQSVTTTTNRVTTTAPTVTTTPATTPTATTLPVPTETLTAGSQGTQVEQLQRALAKLGHAPGAVDGKFGPITEAAVMRFQTAAKLTADGVVGPLTLAALGKALQSSG